MPTQITILGLPGAVWLALAAAICVALFVHRMIFLVRVLIRGSPEYRLNDIPLRIGVFLREVLGQERLLKGESIINWAHPLIFWGFCLFVIASALMFVGGILAPWVHVPQVESIPVLGTLVDLFAVLVLVALAASSFRRYVLRPPGLQRTMDATLVVMLIAGLMITFLLAEIGGMFKEQLAAEAGQATEGWLATQTWLPAASLLGKLMLAAGISREAAVSVGVAAWWGHAAILLFFLVYLPYSKHMHLLWAPVAVLFAELPRRGTLPPATALGEESTPLRQFTWRQLLSAYACAECGRCDRVCPALQSGADLSPREIIAHLKHFVLEEGKRAVKGQPRSEGRKRLVGEEIPAETLWACATCYACMEQCPVRNEHVPIVVQMRRQLINEGSIDASLQEALTSLQRYGNSLGQSPRKRAEWAKRLEFPIKDARKEPVDWLWFVGDYASYDPRCQAVTQTTARVLHLARVDFGILMDKEQNAGNDVRRTGEEGLFELLREKNAQVFEGVSFQQVFTTDPHTYHSLKNDYTVSGNQQEVPCRPLQGKRIVHYSELLEELLREGKLTVRRRLDHVVTFHDPCYLGRYNGVYEAPRSVLRALGVTVVEMPRNRENSFCCGAGGGRIWMKDAPAGGGHERPAESRVREAMSLPGVQYLVVACPKDLAMFQDAIKTVGAEDRLKVVDLAELVWEAVAESCQMKAEQQELAHT